MRIAQLLVVVACVTGTSACVIESGSPPPATPPPPAAQPAQPAQAAAASPATTPAAADPAPASTVNLPANSNTAPAVANDQGWIDLGSTTVTDGAEAGTLAVASSTAFKTVRFGVEGSSIELRNIVLVFDDGQQSALDARHFMRAGGRSQEIALAGGPRVIRQVAFRYQSIDPAVHQAKVHLFGRDEDRMKRIRSRIRRIGSE